MSELFLIAHKVRGEPAFDIAHRIECAECHGECESCVECDSTGFWWVIPTSGHRAYPWWYQTLELELSSLQQMPDSIPDHYQTHAAPRANAKAPPEGIAAMLRAARARAAPKIDRRGF